MHELSELLTAVTPEPYKTTRAAKACIAKLTRDLATSEAALTAERSKVSSLQSDITTSNQTLAHREEALTTANTSIDQHSKQMTILKAAANERQRKLAASHKTICQLSELGQHDKSRLVELTCYNQRLLQLNSITSYTCGKLRQQRNDALLELQTLKDHANQNDISSSSSSDNGSGSIKGEWNPVVHALTKSQVGCCCTRAQPCC